MKKFLTISSALIIVVLFTSQSFGQFRLKIGPNFGLNFNISNGDALTETFTGFGAQMGAQFDMSFTPVIGIITNLNFYDNKSVSTSTTNGTTTQDNALSLAYLMIEPLVKLGIPQSGFYFYVGPVVGFNISASQTLTSTTGNNTPTVQKATLKNLATRFGAKLGAGFDIELSSLLLLTPQFGFEYGFTNLLTNQVLSLRILNLNTAVALKFRII